MTISLTDLADILRVPLGSAACVWLGYAWLHRVAYRRAALGVGALLAVDWLAHAGAAWAERSHSGLPTDFAVYSLFILLAAGAGLSAASVVARRAGVPAAVLLDAALVVVLAGGVGARVYHVWTHWEYYAQNTDDITNLAQGGMGLRGALVLGVGALWLYALARRAPFWKLADAGASGLALAQSLGWYGAFVVGANYGVVSDASFAQDLPDLYGIVAPRVPVQLFASAFFLILFCVLVGSGWRQAKRHGWIFLLYLILSGLGGFALGYGRADETLFVAGLRVDQWVDLAAAGSGLIVLGARLWRAPAPLPAPAAALGTGLARRDG